MGCAEPLQQGSVIVLPGATERLLLAMRMGYAGMGEAKLPASVRRIADADDLMQGPSASGRLGDVRLDNQSMAAVVSQIGGPHSGNLIDLAMKAGGYDDELGEADTIVAGRVVRYETLKTGTDDATSSAFAQVTGHPEGRPDLLVSTRYDVAPELDAVIIHTSIDVVGALGGPVAIGDMVSFPGRLAWGSKPGYVAALGKSSGYVLKPLIDPEATPVSSLISSATERGATIGLAPELVSTGTVVYSRMIAPLDRPDTLAIASALARGDGQELGEVELELVRPVGPKEYGGAFGSFVLVADNGSNESLELFHRGVIRRGDRITAKLPRGGYRVTFEGAGFRTRAPVGFRVVSKQLVSARIVVDAVGPFVSPFVSPSPSVSPSP